MTDAELDRIGAGLWGGIEWVSEHELSPWFLLVEESKV